MRCIWYPCRLTPVPAFNGDRWEPRPGLIAAPISEEEKETWLQASKKFRSSSNSGPDLLMENFEPNFLVKVEEKKCYDSLRQQFTEEGRDDKFREYDKNLKSMFTNHGVDFDYNDNCLFRRPEDLLRWVITSISLYFKTPEISLPAYNYIFKNNLYVGSGSSHVGYNTETSTDINWSLLDNNKAEINTLDNIAKLTERYFNPIVRQVDPMSAALHFFWAFLFSRFPDQAYLSLVTIFEALLSTAENDITHQISERAAILLGNTVEDRVEKYNKIKDIYKLRSKIVHGGIELSKGEISWETNITSATFTNISISSFEELAEIANRLICTILGNPTIMAAIKEKKEKRQQMLNNFFLTSLFSSPEILE